MRNDAQIREEYALPETAARITGHPGKFEGEPLFVPALWDMTMDGGEDDTFDNGDTPVSVFVVDDEMRTAFADFRNDDNNPYGGSYQNVYAVMLWEDEQGFVHFADAGTAEELEQYIAECEESAEEDSEGDDSEDELGEEDIYLGENERSFWYCGKEIVSAADRDSAEIALAAWMEREQYWPDVWSVSDHGNAENITAEIYARTAQGSKS